MCNKTKYYPIYNNGSPSFNDDPCSSKEQCDLIYGWDPQYTGCQAVGEESETH